MKSLIILVSVMFTMFCQVELDEVRKSYEKASKDKSHVENFNALLSKVESDCPNTLLAYKGAAIALKSKYAKGLKEKKELFIKGVTLLEKAINNNPKNVETRFIRFTIQENTPKFLKYKDNLEEDKSFILNEYKSVDSNLLKQQITDYISSSKLFGN